AASSGNRKVKLILNNFTLIYHQILFCYFKELLFMWVFRVDSLFIV
ncbi:MAG: hypothetical protein ACI9XO_004284, partial [Paraglaciecola sp.]